MNSIKIKSEISCLLGTVSLSHPHQQTPNWPNFVFLRYCARCCCYFENISGTITFVQQKRSRRRKIRKTISHQAYPFRSSWVMQMKLDNLNFHFSEKFKFFVRPPPLQFIDTNKLKDQPMQGWVPQTSHKRSVLHIFLLFLVLNLFSLLTHNFQR